MEEFVNINQFETDSWKWKIFTSLKRYDAKGNKVIPEVIKDTKGTIEPDGKVAGRKSPWMTPITSIWQTS